VPWPRARLAVMKHLGVIVGAGLVAVGAAAGRAHRRGFCTETAIKAEPIGRAAARAGSDPG
jgi:hypothetical protein